MLKSHIIMADFVSGLLKPPSISALHGGLVMLSSINGRITGNHIIINIFHMGRLHLANAIRCIVYIIANDKRESAIAKIVNISVIVVRSKKGLPTNGSRVGKDELAKLISESI